MYISSQIFHSKIPHSPSLPSFLCELIQYVCFVKLGLEANSASQKVHIIIYSMNVFYIVRQGFLHGKDMTKNSHVNGFFLYELLIYVSS